MEILRALDAGLRIADVAVKPVFAARIGGARPGSSTAAREAPTSQAADAAAEPCSDAAWTATGPESRHPARAAGADRVGNSAASRHAPGAPARSNEVEAGIAGRNLHGEREQNRQRSARRAGFHGAVRGPNKARASPRANPPGNWARYSAAASAAACGSVDRSSFILCDRALSARGPSGYCRARSSKSRIASRVRPRPLARTAAAKRSFCAPKRECPAMGAATDSGGGRCATRRDGGLAEAASTSFGGARAPSFPVPAGGTPAPAGGTISRELPDALAARSARRATCRCRGRRRVEGRRTA